MRFQGELGRPGGNISQTPAFGKFGIHNLKIAIHPDNRNVEIHEQHVNGRVNPALTIFTEEQSLVRVDRRRKHQAPKFQPERIAKPGNHRRREWSGLVFNSNVSH
jgi:hypothetical protein